MLKAMEPGKSKPTEDAENSDSNVKIIECHVQPKETIFVNPSLISKPTGGSANNSDNDVEILECFGLGAPTLRAKPPPTGENTPVPPAMANATHIPLPLATPPWSPNSLLSGNEPIHMPPGMVLCIPCCMCQKPFYDIGLLKDHLGQHAMEIYQYNLQSQVTGQPIVPQPFLNPIRVHSSSEQSTQPFAPSFNHKHLMKRTQPSANETVECPICKIRLNSRQYLELHNKRFHLQKKTRRSARSMENPFVCKYCYAPYVHKANLNRHMRQKHDYQSFDHQNEPMCRIPSPCSSAASTSESTSTETSTELFNAEPAVNYYPNSGAFMPPFSKSRASGSKSTSTETRSELFNAAPVVDYITDSGQFTLGNGEPTDEFCPPIKAEPGVDSSAATESHEELAAKAAAYYCPPAKWAAMGLPFAKGYYIPMDPYKTYPARGEDGCLPEWNNWISIEDMEKRRKDMNSKKEN